MSPQCKRNWAKYKSHRIEPDKWYQMTDTSDEPTKRKTTRKKLLMSMLARK